MNTKVKAVTPIQLKRMLHGRSELAVLDVREAGQFGDSHLLFATPLPYSRLELDIVMLVPRRSVPIVLCDDGALGVAELAATRLAGLGYADISILEGGTRSWREAGYALFAGVNVPSKTFGELVEQVFHTPRVTARDLVAMKEAGEDFIILDGRPLAEHHKMTIPGSICCPNAELPYRVSSLVKRPDTKIIVNCAGRTRSIIGAQTLINFGVPNPVFALENGTQGWLLSGLPLEFGSERQYPQEIAPIEVARQQEFARMLIQRFAIRSIAADEVEFWLKDTTRSTYLLDVRTPEEFAAGSVPGAVHAPGGQLIQATDHWVGVRNARLVLVDGGEKIRAPVVASWLQQFGCEVYVLEGGVNVGLQAVAPAKPDLPQLDPISAAELKRLLDQGLCTVIDLRSSLNFRQAHIPGSIWSIRPRLSAAVRDAKSPVVVVTDEDDLGRLAAVDLTEAGIRDIRWFAGGLEAWVGECLSTDASPGSPPDDQCIDFLFFVHDRHAGNREAMKQYLAWETGLLLQLDEQDRSSFRIAAPR